MPNRPKGLCPLCGGKKASGKTTYSADLGTGVVVIRNVPASVCSQCGEAWIKAETAKRLEQLSHDAQGRGTQVEVVGF